MWGLEWLDSLMEINRNTATAERHTHRIGDQQHRAATVIGIAGSGATDTARVTAVSGR